MIQVFDHLIVGAAGIHAAQSGITGIIGHGHRHGDIVCDGKHIHMLHPVGIQNALNGFLHTIGLCAGGQQKMTNIHGCVQQLLIFKCREVGFHIPAPLTCYL